MATFSNEDKTSYLLKADLGLILKDDGFGILITTYPGSEIFTKDSKNSATFANESDSTAPTWSNQSKN